MPSTPSVILASTAVMDRAKPTSHWHPGPLLRSLLFVAAACSFSVASAQRDSLLYRDPAFQKAIRSDKAGKHGAAQKAYDQVALDSARRSTALRLKANCLFDHEGRVVEALAAYDLAISSDPNDAANYNDRGLAYQTMGMTTKAITDMRRALVLTDDTDRLVAYRCNIASAHMQVRQWKEALVELDSAKALDSTDLGVQVNRSLSLDELGRYDEGLSILLHANAQHPKDPLVLNNIGYHYTRLNEHAASVTWYEQALEVQPNNASAMNNLGYAELRAGDANSALKHIQRSIEINPSNSYAFRNLGHVWKEMGDLEKACEAYKQALDLGFTNRYGPEVKQHYETYCR